MQPLSVFAYNFPHRKTQDFLFRLRADGFEISDVLAADPVKLNIPPSTVRTKLRHRPALHPEKVSEMIGARYHVVPHRGAELIALLDEIRPEIGVIAGARILKPDVIGKFSAGVINFHPGMIPEARGLDAMLWSIRNDIPLGVTSHLIDRRVDAGRILERRRIELFADDSVFDLSERLYEIQLDMLSEAIARAAAGCWKELEHGTHHNSKMEGALEVETLAMLPEYLRKQLQDDGS